MSIWRGSPHWKPVACPARVKWKRAEEYGEIVIDFTTVLQMLARAFDERAPRRPRNAARMEQTDAQYAACDIHQEAPST